MFFFVIWIIDSQHTLEKNPASWLNAILNLRFYFAIDIVSKLQPADLGSILSIAYSSEEVHLTDAIWQAFPISIQGKSVQFKDEDRANFFSRIQVKAFDVLSP